MTTPTKPSAPHVPTDALEAIARELFNGALPKLPASAPNRRRALLAAEFERAHLTLPGISKRNAATFAALGAPFRAIAEARQARVDAFIAALPKPISQAELRIKLAMAIGDQALKARLHNVRHSIAAALVLIDRLDGRDTEIDFNAFAGAKLVDRLDTVFGQSARQQMLPRGPLFVGDTVRLVAALADAVIDSRDSEATTKPRQFNPARIPAASSSSLSAAELGKLIRAESDPKKRAALFSQLQTVWNSNN